MKRRQHEFPWTELQLTRCRSINQQRQTTDAGKKDGQGRKYNMHLANTCSNNDNPINDPNPLGQPIRVKPCCVCVLYLLEEAS